MRRFARRLINILTALSLLSCVAVVALWVRSYRLKDEIVYVDGRSRYLLTTAGGGFDLAAAADDLFLQGPQGWRWRHWSVAPAARLLWRRSISSPQHPFTRQPWRPPRLGFWWGTLDQPDPYRRTTVPHFVAMGPFWPLALPCAGLPLLWAIRFYRRAVRRTRLGRGFCRTCGYDLRASPERCPECGAAVAAK